MDLTLDALRTIEQLQKKYSWGPGVDYFERLRRTYLRDRQAFLQEINTLEWWGSSGSFADFCCTAENISAESKADDKAYRAALLVIGSAIILAGLRNSRAADWLLIFKQWEDNGI